MSERDENVYKLAIDTLIKPLVDELNVRGYITSDSCQGGGEGSHFRNAYIAFDETGISKHDLAEMRHIVRSFTDTSFRIVHGYYAEWSDFIDYDAGMYSIIFRGRFIPK